MKDSSKNIVPLDTKTIEQLHDEELLDFVRETVTRLNVLADRLERYAVDKIAEKGRDLGA